FGLPGMIGVGARYSVGAGASMLAGVGALALSLRQPEIRPPPPFQPFPATASAEGRLIKGGPFPASATAERPQFNGAASPARGEGVEDPGRRGENRELNGPDTWPGGIAQLGWRRAARAGAGQAPRDEVWKVGWLRR